jgi:hypothetical protein
MRSIEKASNSVQVVYDRHELKATRNNIIQSVDHILGHDLVMEDPHAAAFVTELDRKVQDLKKEFTKSILSISSSRHGKDGELTFPSFDNKKRKYMDNRFKGLLG